MTKMIGGYASQGTPVGVLLADTLTPRIIGDVGNGFSFDFPVRYQVVPEMRSFRRETADGKLREAVVKAARQLAEEGGCLVIAAGSSMFSAFQKDISAAVSVPVMTDPLFMASFLSQIIQPDKKIGILTLDARLLSPGDCAGYGLEEDRIVIKGMEDRPVFMEAFSGQTISFDLEDIEKEAVTAAEELCLAHPEIGAILCESSVFSPFAAAINRRVCLPVFDTVNYINWAASGVLRGLTSPFKNRLDGGTAATPPAWGVKPEHLKGGRIKL